jgi:hypothetical protein
MDDGAIFQFDRDCFVGAFHKESRGAKVNKLVSQDCEEDCRQGCLSMKWSSSGCARTYLTSFILAQVGGQVRRRLIDTAVYRGTRDQEQCSV